MKNEARFSFQASFLTYFLKRGDNFSGNPAKRQRSANRDADNVLRIIMSEESAAAVTRCIQPFNRQEVIAEACKVILKEKAPDIDLVLFPVDRRMGKDYMKGAKQFIEQIKTTIFVPMHFSEDYEGGNALRNFAENAGCRFISITHRGESFEITK